MKDNFLHQGKVPRPLWTGGAVHSERNLLSYFCTYIHSKNIFFNVAILFDRRKLFL